jgi:hypothetical protein
VAGKDEKNLEPAKKKGEKICAIISRKSIEKERGKQPEPKTSRPRTRVAGHRASRGRCVKIS